MKQKLTPAKLALISMVFGLLLVAALIAGCTQSTPSTPATTVATTAPVTPVSTPVATVATAVPTTVATTATPAPVYTPSSGNIVAFTAASLAGASKTIGPSFTAAYPGTAVSFDLDGTQALKTQVENGAYADVFISASNSYTNTLKSEGYFVDGSVKTLTTNYIIVILPASNPANIQSLADLAKPGVKIAMEDKTVPAGTATIAVLNNLANSTYGQSWKNATISNVVTYETSDGRCHQGCPWRSRCGICLPVYGNRSSKWYLPEHHHPKKRQLPPDIYHRYPQGEYQPGQGRMV